MPTVPSNARNLSWGINAPTANPDVPISIGITSDDDMLNMLTGVDRENYLAALEAAAQAAYNSLAANYTVDGIFVYQQTTTTFDNDWPSA